jgi:hypothetical protein
MVLTTDKVPAPEKGNFFERRGLTALRRGRRKVLRKPAAMSQRRRRSKILR